MPRGRGRGPELLLDVDHEAGVQAGPGSGGAQAGEGVEQRAHHHRGEGGRRVEQLIAQHAWKGKRGKEEGGRLEECGGQG